MNQEITPFNFDGSEVRTTTKDGEPWFVAKDVAEILGITWKGAETLSAISEKMKGSALTGHPPQPTLVINEAGVYKLAFRSRKAEAERFTDWIASEVLPAIRKTGRYEVARPDWSIPQSYSDALLLAAQQAKQLEIAAPKVAFYDAVVADDSWFTMQKAAGEINIRGLGRNNLFQFLRDNEIFTSSNVPYRRFQEQGYFRLQPTQTPVGVKMQPMVSQKGMDFILRQWGKRSEAQA